MNLALCNLLDECEKAIPIYHEIAEYNATEGDVDCFDIYETEAKNLEKLIRTIKSELDIYRVINIYVIVNWLNEDKNKEVKEILLDALDTVRTRKKTEKERIQKEIDFCSAFIDLEELKGNEVGL